jgi:hypothetical protein
VATRVTISTSVYSTYVPCYPVMHPIETNAPYWNYLAFTPTHYSYLTTVMAGPLVLDVVGGEQPFLAVAAAPPPAAVRPVNHLETG